MIGETAKMHFLGKKGYTRLNCAQTIAEVFKDKFDFLTDDTVKKFKKMGFGKAPGGECGMLFAATYICENTGNSGRIDEVRNYFIQIAGTTQCKELKKKKIPFCAECLKDTARFINEKIQ